MLKKLEGSMKKNIMAWSSICIFVIVISLLFLVYLNSDGYEGNKFVFEEHLADTLVTVGEEDVTLKDACYYIVVIESNLNAQAMALDPDNPQRYWNTPMNNGEEAGYLSSQAKKDTMDACIRDHIYFKEAIEAGIELTQEETKLCEEDAKDQEKAMTGEAFEVTGYQYQDIYKAVYRTHILKKYMTSLMQKGYKEEELDFDGEYYNQVKKAYNIDINEELWEKVKLGKVTVNK